MVWKNTAQVGIGQANCAGGGSVIAAEYYPPGITWERSPIESAFERVKVARNREML